MALVPLREALRRGELAFAQAIRVAFVVAELWGGMNGPGHGLIARVEADVEETRRKLRERYAAKLEGLGVGRFPTTKRPAPF